VLVTELATAVRGSALLWRLPRLLRLPGESGFSGVESPVGVVGSGEVTRLQSADGREHLEQRELRLVVPHTLGLRAEGLPLEQLVLEHELLVLLRERCDRRGKRVSLGEQRGVAGA